jgi:NTE family protein
MDIVQLIYRRSEPEGHSKDYEFSRASMERRWRQGVADAQGVLRASPWLSPMPKELGVRVFDLNETFSAEKAADRCNLPPKENAESTERTAKAPPTLVNT